MTLNTTTMQLSVAATKTEVTGASESQQPLSAKDVSRFAPGTLVGQFDDLSTLDLLVQGPTNEKQTLTVDATGGTFTLDFLAGGPTGALAFNSSPAQIVTALEALPGIGVGDVAVTGGVGGGGGGTPYTIEFQGLLAAADQALIVTDGALLTGGASTAVIAILQEGGANTPQDIDLTLVDDGFGDPTVFSRIGLIYTRNTNLVLGENLLVGGSGPATPWLGWGTAARIIYPGTIASQPGVDVWVNPNQDPATVVNAGAKLLRVESAKNRISTQIYILGNKV
jgi:hypothetical protein